MASLWIFFLRSGRPIWIRSSISDSIEAIPSATLNLELRDGSTRIFMLNHRYGTARTVEELQRSARLFEPATIIPDDLFRSV